MVKNIHDCLPRAVKGGELDKGRADAALAEYDELVGRYEAVMPRHQAEAAAAEDLKEATSRALRSRRHMVLNQLQMMRRIKPLIEDSPDPARALLDMLETTPGAAWKGENVAFMTQALQAQIANDIRPFLERAGLGVGGKSKDAIVLRDVLRELHGQDSANPAAKALTEGIETAQERLRQMKNAHGGDIGKLDNYGARHSHDGKAIEAAGFRDWYEFVAGKLDWHRIINHKTGKPFAPKAGVRPLDADIEPFLERIYNTLTTKGWDEREPGLAMGGKALYRKDDDARVLHFLDGDSWMEYNARFGTTDPFTALVGGLESQARDVALMRVLGPNPNAGLNFAIQTATKLAETSGDARLARRVGASAKRAKVLLSHLNGAVNVAESEFWATAMSNVRHVNVATKLGSAVVSSVTDLGTITAGSVAMGVNPKNFLGAAVGGVGANATRKQAARMGFTADTLMSLNTSSARLTNDPVASDAFGRLSGFTIRASGLSWWTDAMRLSVQQEGAGHLADMAERGFADLDPMWRDLFERNGLTARDWDALRSPEGRFVEGEADFIAPFWWLEHQNSLPRGEAEGVALRLQSALQDLQELMVPSKRLRGSAALLGETKPGTFIGELARSSAGFKNYAVSLTIGQIHLYQSLPSPQAKAAYLATMAAGTLVLGALAVQLKEITKGRDPRPMDDGKFWLAAALQGGGLGIFGDYLFSETSRAGGGMFQTVAGPSVGFAVDVVNPLMSNAYAAATGENTYWGRDAANFVRYNTPVLSSLWSTRVAFDRLVADQMQKMLDPKAEQNWRRQARRREREYGTRDFWERGALVPERAPDLGNALGGDR